MIVRILGEGQLEVPDAERGELDRLDADLAAAVEAGRDEDFRAALAALLGRVRAAGRPLAADELRGSDLVLPAADADLGDVRTMLTDEGLISG